MGKPNSQTSNAYNVILDKIISYQLAPAALVSDHKLAGELGMSRAPVREAILLLAADGLVVTAANGKSYVTDIGYGDILEIFDLRCAMETEAVRIIERKGWLLEPQLAELETQMNQFTISSQPETILQSNQTDEGFHTAIIRYTENRQMLQVIEKTNLQMLRARWINMAVPKRQTDVLHEHRAIFEAFCAKNAAEAQDAVRTHLTNSVQVFHQIFNDPHFKQLLSGIYSFFY